jgi:hypothetical protein
LYVTSKNHPDHQSGKGKVPCSGKGMKISPFYS